MFFGCDSFSAELLTVIELEWEQVNAKAGFRPFHAISFRITGGATVTPDDQDPIYLQEGEISFTPAGCDFRKQAKKGHIIAIHFTSPDSLPRKIIHFKPRRIEYFKKIFLELHEIWSKKLLGYSHESKMLFYKAIYEIEREWASQSPTVADEKLAPALQHIHTHFAEGGITVSSLCRMCGMSDTYFRRLFVTEFGITPLRYVNRLRMTQIREMLRSNYYSMEEIAERCGFHNIYYFSLFVKKETGVSPKEYRKQLLSTPEMEEVK